jgi:SnoaL-like domain/Aspartyl protease
MPGVLLLLLCGGGVWAQGSVEGDEVPIEKCDVLPVVRLKIDGTEMKFLLDTGATTVLNLGSFAKGRSKEIEVTSWKGTAETSAREVLVPELAMGTHRLHELRLPAIDLSPLSKACGKRIDGILGVDLLGKMEVTIDLKKQVASVSPQAMDARRLYDVMETSMHQCGTAFEQGDMKTLEECFDPEIVFYTPDGEFRGRREVLAYLKERYMKYAPELCYRMTLKDVKSFGDALWYSYDYALDSPTEHQVGHGMSMCRRERGSWRILNLHNSLVERDAKGSDTAKNSR